MRRRARPATRSPRAARASAGVTFLEVVFAAAMLGAAAAAITSAFSTITRFTAREDVRLSANEVAHRLILQFLDDPSTLHPDTDVFPMGKSRFRYLVNKQVLVPEEFGVAEDVTKTGARAAVSTTFADKLKARLLMVTVEVYEDRGARPTGEPMASISRIYNPLSNAEDDQDAFLNHVIDLVGDDPALKGLFEQLKQSGGLRPKSAAPGANQPAPTPAPSGSGKKPRRVGEGVTP